MNLRRQNVVLIGPDSERYRGGIAQFTSRLASELAMHAELEFISWSELYPRFLLAREARGNALSFRAPAKPLLSFSRPWTWSQTAKHIAAIRPDKIVLTWSHPIHAPVYGALVRMLRHKLGRSSTTEYIAVCHNVLPHEAFPGAKKLTVNTFTLFDRIIVHSRSEADRLASLCPHLPCTGAFIPPFDHYALPRPPRPDQAPRLLFFGAIRPYKGLEYLLRALPLVRNAYPNVRLRIAGENFYQPRSSIARLFLPSSNYRPLDLVETLNLRDCVETDIRYIPDKMNYARALLWYECERAKKSKQLRCTTQQ